MNKGYLDFISYVKNNKLGLIEIDAELKNYCTLFIEEFNLTWEF